jgi:hypothetical protein
MPPATLVKTFSASFDETRQDAPGVGRSDSEEDGERAFPGGPARRRSGRAGGHGRWGHLRGTRGQCRSGGWGRGAAPQFLAEKGGIVEHHGRARVAAGQLCGRQRVTVIAPAAGRRGGAAVECAQQEAVLPHRECQHDRKDNSSRHVVLGAEGARSGPARAGDGGREIPGNPAGTVAAHPERRGIFPGAGRKIPRGSRVQRGPSAGAQ